MVAKILRVAWLSVGLGIATELILLLVAAGLGSLPGLKPMVADLVQKVSWSFVVCMGLAAGTAASKHREAVGGLAGAVAAPLAFHIARALHRSTLQALEIAGPAGGRPSPLVLAAIKAVEYAVLGVILASLSKRGSGAKAYALVGLLIGGACAGVIVYLVLSSGAKPNVAALLARAVNEVLFPIGCSLVLFATEAIGRLNASPAFDGRH